MNNTLIIYIWLLLKFMRAFFRLLENYNDSGSPLNDKEQTSVIDKDPEV